jgi:hypothetical protein
MTALPAGSTRYLPTREECIKRAAVHASRGYQVLYLYPIDEAVELIDRPGAPWANKGELRAEILRRRAAAHSV